MHYFVRHLIYTDWGDQPRVVQCDLDGTNPTVLMDITSGLQVPNGKSIHNILQADMHQHEKLSVISCSSQIAAAGPDFELWQVP